MSRKKLHNLGKFYGVGDRIRKVRGKLSQEDFGKLLGGVTKSTVSRYEAGLIPPADALDKIAQVGNVTVGWLLRGDQPSPLRDSTPEPYDSRRAIPNLDYLSRALFLAQTFLKKQRRKLSIKSEAEFAALIYEYIYEAHTDPGELHLRQLFVLIKKQEN